jgi:hypothetical protein
MKSRTLALLSVAMLTLLSLFSAEWSAHAATSEDAKLAKRVAAIKESSRYYHAVGYGDTAEEADRAAINDLCKSITMTVSGVAKSHETLQDEDYSNDAIISTFVTLSNTEKIDVATTPGHWEVLRYVEKSQVEQDMAMRDERIRTLVEQGISLEKRLEIGGALKYFNWAYALAKCSTHSVMLDLRGQTFEAKSWLDSHINTIFSNLSVSLDEVEETGDDLDPYSVNLMVKYSGQPVADLDFAYDNNGTMVRDQHVKNGHASLSFEKLPTDKILMSVYYKYQEEGSQFDPELRTIFSAKRASTFSKSDIEIPCKGPGKKFAVKERKLSKEDARQAKEAAAVAPPIEAPVINRIATESLTDDRGQRLAASMQKVWAAIGAGSYTGLRDLFTTEGYALFLKMMQSGKIKQATTNPNIRIETAGSYLVGKSLPVTVVYKGGNKVPEEIVCRFDADDKIESVAYALTKRAEDDIFRQNEWSMSARYAILHFMEDYQTAYALKRLDYIRKIYSDDAIIIRGEMKQKGGRSTDTGHYFMTDEFTYTKETKDQFLETLARQFADKKYIKLTFEDNEIREQSGVYRNIFWIEIKQFYSSSNYNDQGYLTLMIDMRQADPTIKVRTWAPGKLPLKELMQRYSVN